MIEGCHKYANSQGNKEEQPTKTVREYIRHKTAYDGIGIELGISISIEELALGLEGIKERSRPS